MVSDDLWCKVSLEAISCVTQLDGLVKVEVGRKTTKGDVHMFGKNPSWSRKLHVWGEARDVTEDKNSNTDDKGATIWICQPRK